MELPILENEAPAGSLRLRRQGLYTLFEGRLPPAPGLTRLWVLGAGRPFCLGVMEPRAEGRVLTRRLSRLELQRLPPRPDRAVALPAAAPAPLPPPPGEVPSAARRKGEDLPTTPPSGAARQLPRRGGHSASPAPAAWSRLPDGSLLDPAGRQLALLCAPGAAPERARKISLDGREYWLFRY